MSVVKSDLIKELADSYPSFLRKDLLKLVDIALNEMQDALKRGERVELREIFTIEPKIQKARVSRNPKTNEKLYKKENFKMHFKIGKILHNKLNPS